jgi:hypothetical protein
VGGLLTTSGIDTVGVDIDPYAEAGGGEGSSGMSTHLKCYIFICSFVFKTIYISINMRVIHVYVANRAGRRAFSILILIYLNVHICIHL